MKRFNGPQFLRECVKVYFCSLGLTVLLILLIQWLIQVDAVDDTFVVRYLKSMAVFYLVEIPMTGAILGYFGGTIWVRRLIVMLFTAPLLVIVYGVLAGTLKMGVIVGMLVGYGLLSLIAYLVGDRIEQKTLKKINEQLNNNRG